MISFESGRESGLKKIINLTLKFLVLSTAFIPSKISLFFCLRHRQCPWGLWSPHFSLSISTSQHLCIHTCATPFTHKFSKTVQAEIIPSEKKMWGNKVVDGKHASTISFHSDKNDCNNVLDQELCTHANSRGLEMSWVVWNKFVKLCKVNKVVASF